MPAPETPIKSNAGGSQQQLDAMIADSTVPILAIRSPREAALAPSAETGAAPGSVLALVAQQS
jgi:hypothetical protein